jgi:hypothetical protein
MGCGGLWSRFTEREDGETAPAFALLLVLRRLAKPQSVKMP